MTSHLLFTVGGMATHNIFLRIFFNNWYILFCFNCLMLEFYKNTSELLFLRNSLTKNTKWPIFLLNSLTKNTNWFIFLLNSLTKNTSEFLFLKNSLIENTNWFIFLLNSLTNNTSELLFYINFYYLGVVLIFFPCPLKRSPISATIAFTLALLFADVFKEA